MWIRKCEIDAKIEAPLPVPTQIASNEEFIPPPKSPQQQEVEYRALEIAERQARRRGLSRRDFLRTGSGMAAGVIALNMVFGDCYEGKAEGYEDPETFQEKRPKDQFIFALLTRT